MVVVDEGLIGFSCPALGELSKVCFELVIGEGRVERPSKFISHAPKEEGDCGPGASQMVKGSNKFIKSAHQENKVRVIGASGGVAWTGGRSSSWT